MGIEEVKALLGPDPNFIPVSARGEGVQTTATQGLRSGQFYLTIVEELQYPWTPHSYPYLTTVSEYFAEPPKHF